jgi:hypothetical protein
MDISRNFLGLVDRSGIVDRLGLKTEYQKVSRTIRSASNLKDIAGKIDRSMSVFGILQSVKNW